MIPDTRIAVIGLGLMGGSIARALHARGVRVLGYDRDGTQLDAAVREGIVHEPLDGELAGLATAEVVVLALPVDATIAILPCVASRLGDTRLVMDLGSTKRSIVAAAEAAGIGGRYVGAHPLTGSHRSGWGASRASLFEDARIFLCPTPSTTVGTLELAESLWRELRAGVEVLDAAEHDEQMAWRSHLPHLVSSALALTLRDAGVRRSALGPGGRDMTRLAGGSPTMWHPIVRDNATAIAEALAAYEERIHAVRMALVAGDAAAARGFIESAATWFDGEPERVLTRTTL
ncbi:MAG: prephenate dehydrogenase [Gemmatimonadaceae bacterium]|nr:prephenate dehydrogenase [Gemmatimonadaceae bacterium]NUP71426.1 prephenate dehydrogenase [Gemmatimonadaceae bacterium]NUR35018.1 prephenate dehydrogenase [Gemmatimonadaceae bacterium]NUS48906.1 prephenate dehydrogenase [Gemmatimonadaceae bacterium]